MAAPQFHLEAHVDNLYDHQPRQLAFQAGSAADFAYWQQALRAQIRELLGIAGRVLPPSVQAEFLSSRDRGSYIEEKYALDVGEDVHAPMYVLVPKRDPPYLPILAFHGHIPDVKYMLGSYPDEETAKQRRALDDHYAQSLAEAGYLVCAIEQRGFGERVSGQMHAPDNPISCRHLSFAYMMQGRTMIGERCWDGMLALTYVQNRQDVIRDRVGCTGHSGGGTTALWLSALDERVRVCVPSCYFCSFKHSILGRYHCECNYVPRLLDYAEMGDLAALIAPRPLRLIAGEHDPIFPIEGVHQQYDTVRKAYDLLGAPDALSLAVHPGEHRYDNALAQEWFRRWLLNPDGILPPAR